MRLERPPDRDADFNGVGDVAQWDVARDVWYKKATQGKELPAATENGRGRTKDRMGARSRSTKVAHQAESTIRGSS